ncbi:hypothetical protein P5673_026952 [Acropora cervicornis]|uniref:Uncharacterized protein n=1 Tax=Acropora cervicornis TaxID=6130 RepID=A0AAD9UVX5_ACRCE|nr:hypothetical protein P5673_026952 [Acropora cervicornis]
MVLIEKIKKKTAQELKASCISPEPTELDRLLKEIMERAEACDQSRMTTQEKKQKEQGQAKDIRLKAMESLSETKKRSISHGDGGTEMVTYLREQAKGERDRNNDLCNWRKRLR